LQDISSLVTKNGGDMKTFKSESEYNKALNVQKPLDKETQELL